MCTDDLRAPRRASLPVGLALAAAALLLFSACGGGSSASGGNAAAAPTVSLSANPATLNGSGVVTLNWTSSNSTSCTASGGWSGSQGTSGSASSGTLTANTNFTLSCTGAGGSANSSTTVTVTTPTGVTVSGQITFDKVPFTALAAGGLDFAAAAAAPARGVTVEAIGSASGAVLATTSSDASGQYTLNVAANTSLFVRARAQMLRAGAPAWNFSVRDNTAGDALYVLDGAVFNTGSAATTRNLNAPSGWGGTSYTGTRAAAPFAILDAVYQAYTLVLTANASTVFPTLQLEWSTRNVPAGDGSATALASGQIATTFFTTATNPNPARIYVLGSADSDTDEFDAAVIAHEWGHYYQDSFSRDDSLGGSHSINDKLDPRVAFSEGWGNAFSGMARNDPVYRDSFGAGQHQDFSINVANASSGGTHGWFSEASVQNILWDVFAANPVDVGSVNLGFAPIHAAMIGPVRSNTAFTTLFPLLVALRNANPAQAAAIGQLATSQNITVPVDDYGSTETNSGGDPRNLPPFKVLVPGVSQNVCSTTASGGGTFNRLGNRKFLRFDVTGTRTATVVASNGPTGSDPDLVLYAAGIQRARAETPASGSETLVASSLTAGNYVMEVYEYSNISRGGTPRGDTCFDVTLTLN
jgi:hypothetical protein